MTITTRPSRGILTQLKHDTKGRVYMLCSLGKLRKKHDYDYSLNVENNHISAGIAYAKQLEWPCDFHMVASLDDGGYVHSFSGKNPFEGQPKP